MNSCMTISCGTCEQDIDCRIGYSNRTIQPIQFGCPHCHSQIEIVLDISNAPESNFTFKGCKPSENETDASFNGRNPFVDLHLDFPVKFGEYIQGNTPWFAALELLKNSSGGDQNKAFEMYKFHSLRLDLLNQLYPKADEIKRIINLYSGNNKKIFQKRASAFLEEKEIDSLLPQDLNATLYRLIARAFYPFVIFEQGREISENLPRFLYDINRSSVDLFVNELFESEFIKSLQRDCLKIYPRILAAELSLRPALFLDFVPQDSSGLIAAGVSSHDFVSLKDLYKDIFEVLGRQIVLVAGINNLYHRGSHNKFKLVDGGALSSLRKLSEKNLSDKLKYLDDCWYNLSQDAFNFGLRNAIAHNNVQYNEKKQIITYHPEGGRLELKSGDEMSFLSFCSLLLLSFREMHNLHHVVKSIMYCKYLVLDSPSNKRE